MSNSNAVGSRRRVHSCEAMFRYLLTFLLIVGISHAWVQQRQPQSATRTRKTTTTTTSTVGMVSFLGGNSDSNKLPKLPRDVKAAVSQCRIAVQEALKAQTSRMDVEFPVGTKFGVEKGGTSEKRKGAQEEPNTPTKETFDQSDRELARLFVEMFQPVGGENIAVVFNEASVADAAKKRWKGDASASSRIMSMDRRKFATSQKKKQVKGFAAKMDSEVGDSADMSGPFQLPDGTEVAMFVSPGPKELVVIERVCRSVGMGTLVILLNARLSGVSNFGSDAAAKLFLNDFEPVFNLSAGPQEAAPGCLLNRAYPGDWVLARKPTFGQPRTILSQAVRPLEEECRTAFEALELSDVEKGVENALENVAGWFR